VLRREEQRQTSSNLPDVHSPTMLTPRPALTNSHFLGSSTIVARLGVGPTVTAAIARRRGHQPTALPVDGATDAGPPPATFPALTGSTLNRSPGAGTSPRPLLVLARYLDTLWADNEIEIRSRESMLRSICSVYRGSPSDHGQN